MSLPRRTLISFVEIPRCIESRNMVEKFPGLILGFAGQGIDQANDQSANKGKILLVTGSSALWEGTVDFLSTGYQAGVFVLEFSALPLPSSKENEKPFDLLFEHCEDLVASDPGGYKFLGGILASSITHKGASPEIGLQALCQRVLDPSLFQEELNRVEQVFEMSESDQRLFRRYGRHGIPI